MSEDSQKTSIQQPNPYINIKFQTGLVDGKPNGAQIEEVINVLINRLEQFQAGPLACRENAKTIAYLIQARQWQVERTCKRISQKVEGTNKPHKS